MGSLFFEGLLLQASLIFALGAQNLFVLEAGLKRQNHLIVCLVCFLCDLSLIMLGVMGAASLFSSYPEIKIMVGVLGVTFLFTYGIQKIFSPPQILVEESRDPKIQTLKRSILLAMAFSILNPHAYLDAFILIGGFSTKYSELSDRVYLGLGAAVYSGIWFVLLSSFSSKMKPFLSHPGRLRIVTSMAGLVLVILSWKLGAEVAGWITHEIGPQLALNEMLEYPAAPGLIFSSILY